MDRHEKAEAITGRHRSSLEDIIHNRIIRAVDCLASNAPGGSNEQQHARAVLAFLFTYWEDEIRPRLAKAQGVLANEVRCDAMGDLRILRNVILHSKSIIRPDKHAELKKLGGLFKIDEPLALTYENMHQIFVAVKQDCGKLMLDWLGVKDAPIELEEIVDIAIQKTRRPPQA